MGTTNDEHRLVKLYHRLLVWDIMKKPRTTRYAERVLSPLMGKSSCSICESPREFDAGSRRRTGRSRSEELAMTGAYLAACSARTARFPGSRGGTATRGTTWKWRWPSRYPAPGEARAAYRWLAEAQLGDGSWFNYYLGDRVKDARLDTNVCAYMATGLYHYVLATGDVDFAASLWPTWSAPSSSCCAGSRRRHDSLVP